MVSLSGGGETSVKMVGWPWKAEAIGLEKREEASAVVLSKDRVGVSREGSESDYVRYVSLAVRAMVHQGNTPVFEWVKDRSTRKRGLSQ